MRLLLHRPTQNRILAIGVFGWTMIFGMLSALVTAYYVLYMGRLIIAMATKGNVERAVNPFLWP